jgi:hypothetical protein
MIFLLGNQENGLKGAFKESLAAFNPNCNEP